ncbi:hypothetical protein Ddye_021360 [Dipteronia dyeriana]|uniref:Uncharacterized protein n=1 Tax=Dipteronia dyeriana TaxID=168575 RepID=A0AAD9U2J1_9ROSI|nr:hypothetical protein Ddye_021360 [Dipteronia dyeriana]
MTVDILFNVSITSGEKRRKSSSPLYILVPATYTGPTPKTSSISASSVFSASKLCVWCRFGGGGGGVDLEVAMWVWKWLRCGFGEGGGLEVDLVVDLVDLVMGLAMAVWLWWCRW